MREIEKLRNGDYYKVFDEEIGAKAVKCAILLLCAIFFLPAQAMEVSLSSPDGKYKMIIDDADGLLHYKLAWNEKDVIKTSQLGRSPSFGHFGGMVSYLCWPLKILAEMIGISSRLQT